MTERLTTLQSAKDWLEITNDDSDTAIVRLIDAASRFLFGYLGRDSFLTKERVYDFKGAGNGIMLPHWPVLSVNSLGISGTAIMPAVARPFGAPSSGYRIVPVTPDPMGPVEINVAGYLFGGAPGVIEYTTGYQTAEINKLVAVDGVIAVSTTSGGQWIGDLGVTLDNVPAVPVKADPQQGEYSVSDWGLYTFNIADADRISEISFNYAPWDVAFAVTQMVGEWWKKKERIGVLSKTLGGQETITFSQQDITDGIRGMLSAYQRVWPG